MPASAAAGADASLQESRLTIPARGHESEDTTLLRRALAANCGDPGLWSDLSIAYRDLGQLEPAIACFLEAEQLDPHNPSWRLHTANGLVESGELEHGLSRLNQFLVDDPVNPQAHWQRAYALLLQGRFEEAWPEFAWRWRCPGFPSRRLPTPQPAWDGRRACRRLLLWGEQGLGDEVMLTGLIPDARRWLATRGVECELLLDGRLVGLLGRAWPDLPIHAWGAGPIHSCDQHLPLGDLCRQLRPAAASFPAKVRPWLQADPARREALAAALPRRGAPRLGLAWHSEAAVLGPRKSIALAALAAAVTRPGLELVCLQYGPVEAELAALRQATGTEVRTLAGLDRRDDLEGMAALIESCDLVITISNATAHLSGALGRPTWLLLHHVPYWPWQFAGEHCLWYDSVRLFRQRHGGIWQEPLAELGKALEEWLEKLERTATIIGSC